MTTKRYASRVRRPTQTHTQKPDGMTWRLAVCLILCAAAVFCRIYYPSGIEAVSQVVFGEQDNAIRAAFSGFAEDLKTDGIAQAFSGLYDELTGHAED